MSKLNVPVLPTRDCRVSTSKTLTKDIWFSSPTVNTSITELP